MDTEPVAESQPSKEILDQSTSSYLVPTNLEQVLQLSYPGEPTQNPSKVELDLRKVLPHQLIEKIKDLTKLFHKVDLQLIPSDVNTFLDSISTVLEEMGADKSFTTAVTILIIKDIF
ncbi:MAG: hypothetical protein GY861_25670 [bacterium]|nr:hypothetical protein [bacterium]